VRLPLYQRTHPGQSDAVRRATQGGQDPPPLTPQPAVGALLDAVDRDHESQRRTDWPERDLALILTGLLAGLRADELRRANIGDIRTSTDSGAVIHVRGKGSKDRTVPIEADLFSASMTTSTARPSASPRP
jgi:integrase